MDKIEELIYQVEVILSKIRDNPIVIIWESLKLHKEKLLVVNDSLPKDKDTNENNSNKNNPDF